MVDSLTAAGVPVRALTRRPEAAALPANVEIVTGDLTVPESLDAALRDVGAVFLVWTVPPASAPAVVERLAARARRVVFLSSPHQTPHPFFQQPNPMAVLHADIERLSRPPGLIDDPGRDDRVEHAVLVGAPIRATASSGGPTPRGTRR